MAKIYKQILPFFENEKSIHQFGFLPMSILNPEKSQKKKWNIAYLNDGINETKRGKNVKFLANLKFSEFHAGLAENIINYWSLPGSIIVDPFAGRVTRAVVSSKLGRIYHGCEISPITYNRVSSHLKKNNIKNAHLYLADGIKMEKIKNEFADLVFTCPPYHKLELYESVPGQLSKLDTYEEFLEAMTTAAININRVLKPGAFVAIVVADWRDGKAFRTFHCDIINIFNKNKLISHDIIIIKNNSPFAAFMVGKVTASRYTNKIHEYLLIFKKEGVYDYSWYSPKKLSNQFF